MKEFLEVADGKLNPKLMSEVLFKKNVSKDESLSAKDNPPTDSQRGQTDTARTIDAAQEYTRRLESDLKAKVNEHQYLKARLEQAIEKQNHPSMGSWQQNSDVLANKDDDFGHYLSKDRQT